jgi:hypothetical protein
MEAKTDFLLGFGIDSLEIFKIFNFFVLLSITNKSLRSLINLPPKI